VRAIQMQTLSIPEPQHRNRYGYCKFCRTASQWFAVAFIILAIRRCNRLRLSVIAWKPP